LPLLTDGGRAPPGSVLVIEYGTIEYAPGLFDPPTIWIVPAPDAATAWTFLSLPNPEVNNKTAFVQAGQVVGGSSAVNGMFFDRPSRFDLDLWAEIGGPEYATWKWQGVFPFFRKVSGSLQYPRFLCCLHQT